MLFVVAAIVHTLFHDRIPYRQTDTHMLNFWLWATRVIAEEENSSSNRRPKE
jgi:hypothetical protein